MDNNNTCIVAKHTIPEIARTTTTATTGAAIAEAEISAAFKISATVRIITAPATEAICTTPEIDRKTARY